MRREGVQGTAPGTSADAGLMAGRTAPAALRHAVQWFDVPVVLVPVVRFCLCRQQRARRGRWRVERCCRCRYRLDAARCSLRTLGGPTGRPMLRLQAAGSQCSRHCQLDMSDRSSPQHHSTGAMPSAGCSRVCDRTGSRPSDVSLPASVLSSRLPILKDCPIAARRCERCGCGAFWFRCSLQTGRCN